MNITKIDELNLKHKRVFLRADLNIPITNNREVQDYKLKSIIPTIKYIQENDGKVILATHIGRPKAEDQTNFFDENLSTEILIPWFEKNGFKIRLERDLEKAEIFSKEDFHEILLLENLRFFNGEKGTPEERENFVNILKPLADVYINDAFGLIHRNDTSVTLLPQQFKEKAIGLLMQKEIQELNNIKEKPANPFILVLGGIKIKSKTAMLENFLNTKEENRPNSILIGGAIANTFLKAKGLEVGKSIVKNELLDFAKSFLEKAKKQNIEIILPVDRLLESEKIIDVTQTKKEDTFVDIGPKTIKLFEEKINKAKTIFTNGPMGIYKIPKYAGGTKAILESIANSEAYTVAGGGDCVAASYMFHLQDKFNFLSTGGGATLAFLGAKNIYDLPGLKFLN